MAVEEQEEVQHDGPTRYRKPIWFETQHLLWLDQEVARLRHEDRAKGGEGTHISRSSVIREWIEKNIKENS